MNKKKDWIMISIIASILFGIANIYTNRLLYFENKFVLLSGMEVLKLLITSTLFFLFILLLINISGFKIWDKIEKLKISELPVKKIYIVSFVIIFITSIVCFLTFFPGAGNLDSYLILHYDTDMSRQHPMAYCLYIRILKAIFLEMGGYSLVIVINTIIQILVWCAVITYCAIWLLKRNHSKFWVLITVLFYALTPIYSIYVITMLKDTFFAVLCILWIPMLIDLIDSNGEIIKRRYIYFILLTLTTSMLRSNARFIFIALLIYLLVKFRKNYFKYFLTTIIMTVIITSLPGMFMTYKGNPSWFQEQAGVLIQQIAAVTVESGEEAFTEEQLELLNGIMPIEMIQEKYSPVNADFIKWDENFNRVYLNEHSSEFVLMWIDLLPENFSTYVEAWLWDTYGFWSVNLRGVEYWTSYYEFTNPILPSNLQNSMETIYSKTTKFLNEGSLFWLFMAICCAFLAKKRKYFIILLPFLINFFTIFVSTPVATQYRYVLMLPFSLPMIIQILFEKEENINNFGT